VLLRHGQVRNIWQLRDLKNRAMVTIATKDGRTQQVPFGRGYQTGGGVHAVGTAELVNLREQARGINPDAADPRAIFVMRAQAKPGQPPLVYQFDMRRPEVIALANRFVLRDEDALLISNASWAQTRQVIAAFSQGLASVRSAATIPVP